MIATTQTITIQDIDSPIGTIVLAATAAGACAIDFADRRATVMDRLERRFGGLKLSRLPRRDDAAERLRAFFAGDLRTLDSIAVDPGGTPFQREVWSALRRVRPGRTISYGALATRIGRPAAVRAVGAANARNPVAIVIPCHRVIGADGSLTGYASGLDRKQWLLDHEEKHA
jgi:methylated-DNA-[protein]-cysteine S-methyltransferase